MKEETIGKVEKIGQSWIGTPYFHMSKTKGAGADCALFLACIFEEAGILSKVENLYYSRTWMISGVQELLIEGFERHLTEYITPGFAYEKFEFRAGGGQQDFEYKRGDILCMTTNLSKVCHHAAMYVGGGEMLHAYQKKGVCRAQFAHFWKDRIRAILRIIED